MVAFAVGDLAFDAGDFLAGVVFFAGVFLVTSFFAAALLAGVVFALGFAFAAGLPFVVALATACEGSSALWFKKRVENRKERIVGSKRRISKVTMHSSIIARQQVGNFVRF